MNPVHFIGISGSGMLPLAKYCLDLGLKVQGSDYDISTAKQILQNPKRQNAQLFSNHLSENISKELTVVYSSAIPSHNEELIVAKQKNIETLHRSQFLSQIAKQHKISIAVCGTHGKTTTASLLGHILKASGASVNVIIGGIGKGFQSTYDPKAEFLVFEADESDGTILNYEPDAIVATSLDEDHLDYFKTPENLFNTFLKFFNEKSPNAKLFFNFESKNLMTLSPKIVDSSRLVSFGRSSQSRVWYRNYRSEMGKSRFELVSPTNHHMFNNVPFFGDFNALNLVGAITAAMSILDIDLSRVAESLKDWKGVEKRQSILLDKPNITVIDDYAHNPDKIRSYIEGSKANWPDSLHITVFEPHRYSRVKALFERFMCAFEKSDYVFVLPIFPAGEAPDPEICPNTIATHIRNKSNTLSEAIDNLKKVCDIIAINDNKHILVSFLGAGFSSKLARSFISLLEEKGGNGKACKQKCFKSPKSH